MILTCPSCATRYAVDPAALGVDGRKVRCARCGHQWFQAAPAPAADAADRPPVSATPPPGATPRPIPPGSNLPAPARPRRSSAAAGWMLLVLLVAGLVAVGYVGRERIVRLWPPSIKLYQELGVDVAGLDLGGLDGVGAGLALANLTSERTRVTGVPMLWLRGEVTNESAVSRTVPPLRVEVSDGDGRPLADWTLTVDPPVLEPGETARFESSLHNVDDAAAKLVISAAPES